MAAKAPTFAQRINKGLRRVPPWLIYVIGFAWMGWEFWRALSAIGPYAVEPINVLEREYGLRALQLLVAGLVVTPLMRWTRVSLIRFRRAIGLMAFYFVLAHFAVFVLLDLGGFFDPGYALAQVWTETIKRPYITVGMAALVLLIPLALTSNDWAMRRMRQGWKQMHRLVYVIVPLAGVHFLWLAKGFQIEPILYLVGTALLLALRVDWRGLMERKSPNKAA
ncbi:protein-methionine-sulfoxide reductase heme-binding subunit MsrQ [Pseudoroseicyclus aestuarii]|uniref:Protein-methionine-sulfoxide reductase heme-binding subunit MsrQ n=1 Tax=Pseudoroseicyclus aestuarii TaxID=1795041 RepID=A0A318SV38_9RHOB|nr:protein-methionine-sulfoxide reductase heme-binding subunit MsrQ [Pseudoroseicyclus aestuarii]PYE84209.1 sulfoxide reductase heme-binding subunit YedZ [Pseudoroseicyclus aestuarii]